MSMKELLEVKHPTSWVEFEKGLIDEVMHGNSGRKIFSDINHL